MSTKGGHVVGAIVIAVICCSHSAWQVSAQYQSGEQCRSQCLGAYNFYRRFITSQSFLQNYLTSCYNRCPPVWQTSPTTTTTTTTRRTTTTTRRTTTTSRITRNGDCGISAQSRFRIVGGHNAYECEYPWIVGISFGSTFCGGAILDKRHILTAAHCLRNKHTGQVALPSEVLVRAGSSRLSGLRIYRVLRVQLDRRYVVHINDYDVAILTLTVDLLYSYCISPICLPEPGDDPMDTEYCVAAGWGLTHWTSNTLTQELQKVRLPIVPNRQCLQSYGSQYINDLKLCAGDFYNGGIDSCQGDSGGPLMCYKDGRFIVHGIVSTGARCALARHPGIYTRVANKQINDYIRQTTRLY